MVVWRFAPKEPETLFFGYFLLPETRFFSTTKPGYLKKTGLLLYSNISNSDNTEVADWRVYWPNAPI